MEKSNCQQTSLQMPTALNSVMNKMSIYNSPLLNSEIGQSLNAPAITTGKPPSATVLGGLRDLAKDALTGAEVSDQSLLALLKQHFGSRLVIKEKMRQINDNDGGYDSRLCCYGVELDGLGDDEMSIFEALEFFNKPAKPEIVAGCFAKMRTVLLRRNETEQDIEILIDTLVDLCRHFPNDVIVSSSRQWMQEKKFFPIPKEFIALCDEKMFLRRAIVKTFEECRNPLLAGKREAKRITSDPRLQMHFKELPREKWLECHYDLWIAEADKMEAMYADNKDTTKSSEWREEANRRRDEMLKSSWITMAC
jgi:hypothetical protein